MISCKLELPLDRFALDVSFESSARTLAVFGPSGSGKTSLLESLAGLRARARGWIRVEGDTWLDGSSSRPPERRGVGLVPQDGLLFPHLTVRGNLDASAHPTAEKTLGEVTRVLGLEPLLDRRPASLSGGERQRVALGRALCSSPRLLLLDEPLASLDLGLRRRLLAFLADIKQRFDVPTVLVSHDLVEVQALADDVLVLDQGRVVAQGPPRDVLKSARVVPLGPESGFENALAGTVRHSSPEGATIALGAGADLVARPTDCAEGSGAIVTFAARDVIVATELPAKISARNVLAGEVTAIDEAGTRLLFSICVAEGVPAIVAELSRAAVQDLDLRIGQRVHVVIKSSSIAVAALPSCA